MSFCFNVHFTPQMDFKDFDGNIIFLSFRPDSEVKLDFKIPFECILPKSDVTINPQTVMFKKFPYWEAEKVVNRTFMNVEVRQGTNILKCLS